MLRVGLTGGIGSGKTTISNQFSSAYGTPIIDADEISRQLLLPNGKAYEETINLFGPECVLESNDINRKFIREKIFTDDSLRLLLENIIHPKVEAEISAQVKSLDAQYCLIVIPLLIESNMQSMVDRILVIDINKQSQLNRVASRDRCEIKHVEAIVNAQIDSAERLKYADDIITNNGQPEDLITQIHQLHEKYLDLTN
ncbi:MAG: dephospho-CoA kinase [Gammaproteobacteria bacterium]